MSQLNVQIAFAAIFVLFAFDDGPNAGPVKIRSLFFPIYEYEYDFVTFYRSCWCHFCWDKILDASHARLLSQHSSPGIVSKQKRHNATDCFSNVLAGKRIFIVNWQRNAIHLIVIKAWDDKLYNYALNWSKQCKFEHTNGPYGENLWMITSSNLNDSEFFDLGKNIIEKF